MSNSSPGALDQRVQIQRVARVSDGAGGTTDTWAVIATTWARVAPKSGSEGVAAMQSREATVYDVTMRASVDVTAADRLVRAGLTLKIDSAPPSGRDLYRALVAVEDITRSA